jgi:uncharacterized protein (DUF39 family)
MGPMADALTELEQRKCKIDNVFQSVIYDPGEYYQNYQNATNKLELNLRIVLKCQKPVIGTVFLVCTNTASVAVSYQQ